MKPNAISDLRLISELLRHLGDARNLPRVARRLLIFLLDTSDADLAAYYNGGPAYADQIFYETSGGAAEPAELLRVYQSAQRSWRQYVAPYVALNGGSPEPEAGVSGPTFWYRWFEDGKGGVFLLRRRGGMVISDTEAARLEHFCSIARRMVEIALDYAVSERQVVNDFLTGLYNRRYLDQQLPREMERARRFQTGFSLVLLDLDGFKGFNDTYGHRRGDQLLSRVGTVLAGSLRRIDVAARYGGDEFALILPQTNPEQAQVLLRRVGERVKAIGAEMGLAAQVGASFGVAHFPSEASTLEDLVETADARLYQAKEQLKRSREPARRATEQTGQGPA